MAGKRDLVETVYCEHCSNHFGSEKSLLDHYRINHPNYNLPYYEVKKIKNIPFMTSNKDKSFSKYNPFAPKDGISFFDPIANRTERDGISVLIPPNPIPGKFIIVLEKGKKFVKWSKKG